MSHQRETQELLVDAWGDDNIHRVNALQRVHFIVAVRLIVEADAAWGSL